ncbi:unnamed protein product [Diatraea saccharalis]|uniref:RanBD1 domain-containing protein n=1 Tax=Diatraea saccharalis TaxID=40085 RepID=A0A9N9QXA6_9NEOP|nr:unnamed protein product [Diatraea saccharalis]
MADAKQGKSPMEDYCNGSSQSRVVLAKPRLGGFGSSNFASSSNKSCNPFGSVLRPPQLKATTNPFLKVTENLESDSEKDKNKEKTESEIDEKHNEDRLKENKDEPEAPKFIPLGSANVTPRTNNPVAAPVQPASGSSGFVFGQNLSERVVLNENLNNGEASAVDHSSTNGATELLFTSAVASVKENNQQPEEPGPSEASSSTESSSLAAAAAEYERSHARPPPPTTNYTTTGEEGEINVLQISCRLFAWESGSWRERGRGVLRLNDAAAAAGGGARLVARVAGSLRVVLNTKLWPAMVVERAGTKSLRITAADAHQQVKLFLIMGAPADIHQLYRALTTRISVNKRSSECAQNVTSQQAAERLEATADVSEYMDKADNETYGRAPSENTVESIVDDSPSPTERLEGTPVKDTDVTEPDDVERKEDSKSLKRKESAEDETSSKRQRSEVLTE